MEMEILNSCKPILGESVATFIGSLVGGSIDILLTAVVAFSRGPSSVTWSIGCATKSTFLGKIISLTIDAPPPVKVSTVGIEGAEGQYELAGGEAYLNGEPSWEPDGGTVVVAF
jgi:hypothetical protein